MRSTTINPSDSKSKFLIWLPFGLVIIGFAIYEGLLPPPSSTYPPDFSIFQTAAVIIRSGMSNRLYDLGTQREVFFKIVGPTFSQFLVWNHPPAEALVYLPFGFVNFGTGFIVIRVFNSLLLSVIVLWSHYRIRAHGNSLLLTTLAFMFSLRPLSGTISTGQDSLWILLVTLAALYAVIDSRPAPAALLLGLASIKFTITLPLLVIFFIVGFQSLALNATLASLLVWLIPTIVFGSAVTRSYIQLCIHLAGVDHQMGMHSGLLWNFRGILFKFISSPIETIYLSMILGLTCAVLVRFVPRRHAIPASLFVATFFSPHAYQHDAIMYTGAVVLWIAIGSRNPPAPQPVVEG